MDTDCWFWTAAKVKEYAKFWWDGKQRTAHRLAYQLTVGEIPDGYDPDHLCKVKGCVNVNHLEVVTRWENLRRADVPSILYGERTHCGYGHEYTPENTYIRANGEGRSCKECGRRTSLAYFHRKRAERATT